MAAFLLLKWERTHEEVVRLQAREDKNNLKMLFLPQAAKFC